MKKVVHSYLGLSIFNWAFVVVGGLALSVLTVKGCGRKEKTVYVGEENPTPPPAETCDGETLGASKKLSCQEGYAGNILQVCQAGGKWVEVDNSCQKEQDQCEKVSENKVTFEKDIKPIMVEKCLTCHITPERYDDYAVIKGLMGGPSYKIQDRINRDDERRMPKPPLPPLDASERDLIDQWLQDGLLESTECSDKDPSGNEFIHLNLDYIEDKILQDLNRLDSRSRANARYLVLSHKYNIRPEDIAMKMFQKGVFKGVNSLSTEESISLATPIDVRESIYRINLEDFGLEAGRGTRGSGNDWDLIIDEEPFNFESFTTRGLLIKQLTLTNQPWLHADNFNFTALLDNLYYDIIGVAADRDTFFEQVGVDLQQKYDDFEVIAAGGFGSPISLNKNRMITRVECERSLLCKDGGYVWITYDPVDLDGVPERNLFEFPFAVEARSAKVFDFAAGEIFWTLPNGMQGYILFDAAGVRQTFAPVNIVQDVESVFDPQIDNALDCNRCHAKGILPQQDQIRQHVLANAAEFDREDVDKVEAYYLPQTALTATYTADNVAYSNALNRIGLDNKTEDPINFLVDRHRKDWVLEEFCGFIFLEVEDCAREINGSAVVKAQIGQLVSGGSASLNQIIEVFPQVILDFRLGQEAIND